MDVSAFNSITPASNQKHVTYILIAEFDIKNGSNLAYQFPYPTGYSEQVIAELMLPDGVHKRDEDWTVFFLNREDDNDGNQEVDEPEVLDAFLYRYVEDGDDSWVLVSPERVKVSCGDRGVDVHTADNEPLLSISPDPSIAYTCLDPQFGCVVASRAAIGLRFSTVDDESIFRRAMEVVMSPPEENEEEEEPATGQFLYCLNLCRQRREKDADRGAIVKSMAICSRHPFVHIYKPVLILALEEYFQKPGIDSLRALYEAVNAMDVTGMPRLNPREQALLRDSLAPGEVKSFPTAITYSGIRIPMNIPLATTPDVVGDASLIDLVNLFKENVMVIWNALLSERQVVFMGYEIPSRKVSDMVLASVAMVCPPLTGLARRAWPYAGLQDLSFQEVDGFVTGTTNKVFEVRESWWDVLCNLNTGVVRWSTERFPGMAAKKEPEMHTDVDEAFYASVRTAIDRHAREEDIRRMFYDYTQHVLDMATNDEVFANEKVEAKQLKINSERLAILKSTTAFKQYLKVWEGLRANPIIDGINVRTSIRMLRVCDSLDEMDLLIILRGFLDHVVTWEQIMEFLCYLPAARDGLFPIASHLFNASSEVRNLTARLLTRIANTPAGADHVSALNPFCLAAFARAATALGDGDQETWQ